MPQPALNVHVVQQFARKAAIICPQHAEDVVALASLPVLSQATTEDAMKHCASVYGGDLGSGKPFIFSQGIAVIPVWGALLHRSPWMSPYATGYEYIGSRFAQAMADPDVKGIVFDVNSYGGHVAGNFELADEIYAGREKKPSIAIVDSNALSGGYSLSSATGKIVATPSAQLGSIGVVMMHMSIEKALKDFGVKVTFIYAGKHKVDGNPFEDLPPDVKAALTASVKRSYDSFVSLVSRNRGMDADAVRKTEAAVIDAEEAQSLGLIDAVMPARAALAAFAAELTSGSTPTTKKEAKKMDNDKKGKKGGDEEELTQADVSAAAETARKAERARIKGIMTHEAAAKRPKLASHLANESEMSVEQAVAVLEASAEEQPEKSADGAPGKGPLSEAMKKDANKTAGEDGEDEDDDKPKVSRAQQISQAYQAATGVDMTAKKK